MKAIRLSILTSLFLLFSAIGLFAQHFSYVDTEYILDKMPEYKSAQKQLDNLAEEWKKEVDVKMKEVDKLYKQYQSEQLLLPGEQRKKKEDEILQKEDELNKFKEAKFGKEGELFKKRQELVKPIQDKVFDAIQKLAKDEGIDFIFDKAGAVTMLYTNAKYDRSEEILEILGVTKTEK
jgi:outer membrane protein